MDNESNLKEPLLQKAEFKDKKTSFRASVYLKSAHIWAYTTLLVLYGLLAIFGLTGLTKQFPNLPYYLYGAAAASYLALLLRHAAHKRRHLSHKHKTT